MKQRTSNGNTGYAFHAKNLDCDLLIACPVTGMVSKMQSVWLPIALSQKHPLSEYKNALSVIAALEKSKQWPKAESQLIAGCVLSLLTVKGKVGDFPNSSASEANMMLQSAGALQLQELATIIHTRWDSEATWLRVPKLSFDLTAYSTPQASMTSVVSGYIRKIRKAFSLDELPEADRAEVYKAYKENMLKLRKAKGGSEGIIVHSLTAIKTQTIDRQTVSAKLLLRDLQPHMPTVLGKVVGNIVANLGLWGQAKRQEIASKVRQQFISSAWQEKATSLAFILENAQVLEEDMLGLSETVSPTSTETKRTEYKSVKQIMAEKLAAIAAAKAREQANG